MPSHRKRSQGNSILSKKETTLYNFNDEDFIIRITPSLDEEGYWDGDITIGIVTTTDNSLDNEDFMAMMKLATLVCSSIPVMEDNEVVRKAIQEYAREYQEDIEDLEPGFLDTPDTIKRDGNVVTVNFGKR
jgi:hypothetical protein